MAAVVAWLLKISVAAMKWSVVHPISALLVTGGLKISANYLRKQRWAGAGLLADLIGGVIPLYKWPAIGRLAFEVTGAAGERLLRMLGILDPVGTPGKIFRGLGPSAYGIR